MAYSPAPTLDQLQSSDQPAWLWDGARARVIWANTAGIELFGGETLFDLIDRPFDPRDPDIAQIAQLSQSLQRSDRQSAQFEFAAAIEDPATVECTCSIHALPDGRPGVLIVAERVHRPATEPDSGLMTGILGSMPIAIVVCDPAGEVIYSNAASSELLAQRMRSNLAALTGSQEDADALLERIVVARTLSILRTLDTNFGDREIRLTARLLDEDNEDSAANILVMLEDVTERRALERELSNQGYAPAPSIQPADTGQEQQVDAPQQLAELSRAINQEIADTTVREVVEDDQPVVPGLVSRTLNKLPDAIVLHRDGQLFFANDAALEALEFNEPSDLAKRTDIFELLQQPPGGPVQIELTDARGEQQRFDLTTGTFPWHDGPVVQSTLRRTRNEVQPTDLMQSDGVPAREPDDGQPVGEIGEPTMDTPPQESARDPGDPELRAILDTATDGIVTLDQDGNVLSFSAGAEALFDYRLADVAGRPFADLLAAGSKSTLRDYLAALGDGGLASVFNDGREVTGVVSQGGEISLFMTIARLGEASAAAYCAVLRDITQWKKTEAQLREDKDAAERSNAQKSEFLAQISHELRTPLNAILGFSDVMRTERFGEIENEKYLGYANDIHKSGTHLLSLINDLLDLSKVEAGKLELNFTSVDLRGIIADCFNLMQEQATGARVVLRKSLPSKLPSVVADFRSIKQIVLNLLSNAIKFTDPGGQVIVSARLSSDGELVLKFKDTGIGMNAKELQAAMEPFNRVETPERGEQAGTGLGLPLTKALTEANRAEFDISSEPKKGTLVEITFPTTRVLAD